MPEVKERTSLVQYGLQLAAKAEAGQAQVPPREFPVPPLDVSLIFECHPDVHGGLPKEVLERMVGKNPEPPDNTKEINRLLKFAKEAADPESSAEYPIAWVRAKAFAQETQFNLAQRKDKSWQYSTTPDAKRASFYADYRKYWDPRRAHGDGDWYNVRGIPHQTDKGIIEMPADPALAQYLVRNYGDDGASSLMSEYLCYYEDPFHDSGKGTNPYRLAAVGVMLQSGLQAAFDPQRVPLQMTKEGVNEDAIARRQAAVNLAAAAIKVDPKEITREEFVAKDANGERFELFVDDQGKPFSLSKDEMKVMLGIMADPVKFREDVSPVDSPWEKVRPLQVYGEHISPCAPGGKPVTISKSEAPPALDKDFMVNECGVGGAGDWRYWAAKPSALSPEQWAAIPKALASQFPDQGDLPRLQLIGRAIERISKQSKQQEKAQQVEFAVAQLVKPEERAQFEEIRTNLESTLEFISLEKIAEEIRKEDPSLDESAVQQEANKKVTAETANADYVRIATPMSADLVAFIVLRMGELATEDKNLRIIESGRQYQLQVRNDTHVWNFYQSDIFPNYLKVMYDVRENVNVTNQKEFGRVQEMITPVAEEEKMSAQEWMQGVMTFFGTAGFAVIMIGQALATRKERKMARDAMQKQLEHMDKIQLAGEGKYTDGLDAFGRWMKDLQHEARQGILKKMDLTIRMPEIIETARGLLSGRSVVLLGPPGRGKSAIVEGLSFALDAAYQQLEVWESGKRESIADFAELPPELRSILMELAYQNFRLHELDVGQLDKEGKYVGGGKGAMSALLIDNRERRKGGENPVVSWPEFKPDEMHVSKDSGSTIDVLKPDMAHSDQARRLQILADQTGEEYRKYIGTNGALDRRFRKVFVSDIKDPAALARIIGAVTSRSGAAHSGAQQVQPISAQEKPAAMRGFLGGLWKPWGKKTPGAETAKTEVFKYEPRSREFAYPDLPVTEDARLYLAEHAIKNPKFVASESGSEQVGSVSVAVDLALDVSQWRRMKVMGGVDPMAFETFEAWETARRAAYAGLDATTVEHVQAYLAEVEAGSMVAEGAHEGVTADGLGRDQKIPDLRAIAAQLERPTDPVARAAEVVRVGSSSSLVLPGTADVERYAGHGGGGSGGGRGPMQRRAEVEALSPMAPLSRAAARVRGIGRRFDPRKP